MFDSWPNTSKFQTISSDFIKNILQQYEGDPTKEENQENQETPSRRKLGNLLLLFFLSMIL